MCQMYQNAVNHLKSGKLIGLPTETVYGLAADATNPDAIRAIYTLKNRPTNNPLIIHVDSLEMAKRLGKFDEISQNLAQKFWPGALTLVLPIQPNCNIAADALAGGNSIALRIPNHPIALEIIKQTNLPLAAPSANPSGKLSPTHADDVKKCFPDLLVLDGGACDAGLESTVVRTQQDRIELLRPGIITAEMLEDAMGKSISSTPSEHKTASSGTMPSPGMLSKHYAPDLPVRLDATSARAGEAYLGFAKYHQSGMLNLSPSGNLEEAAQNLFSMIRQLDDSSVYQGIAIAPIPCQGVGAAINDRLSRATLR